MPVAPMGSWAEREEDRDPDRAFDEVSEPQASDATQLVELLHSWRCSTDSDVRRLRSQ